MTTPPSANDLKINVNKWRLNDSYTLTSYTALWCKPCQNIKPFLLDFTKDRVHLGHEEISKNSRPEHVKYIPWFDISDKDHVVEQIQTSSGEEFLKQLNKYKNDPKLDDFFEKVDF